MYPVKVKVHCNGKILSIIVKRIWSLFNLAAYQGDSDMSHRMAYLASKKNTQAASLILQPKRMFL